MRASWPARKTTHEASRPNCRCCRSSWPSTPRRRSRVIADSFDEFNATKLRIDSIVKALRLGSATENVPGYEGSKLQPGVSLSLKKVTDVWTKMSADADRIVKSKEQILNLTTTANAFTGRIPQVSARLDEVVRAMSDSGAAASQINIANRQIVLADRMSRRVTEILCRR